MYFDTQDPPVRLEFPAPAGEYTIVVRATDPSGEIALEENRDDIVVKITATNVDEAPGVTDGMAELSVCEVNSTPAEEAPLTWASATIGMLTTDQSDDATVDTITNTNE